MAGFDWLLKVGGTREAVAVLNNQPALFSNLIAVIVGLSLECLLIWFIHFATMKPEHKSGKGKKASGPGAEGEAARKASQSTLFLG